jgi:hypothetical protein
LYGQKKLLEKDTYMEPVEITIWVCAAVFAVTAVITLRALVGKTRLGRTREAHDSYLRQLFRILILEVVVISVGGFSHYIFTKRETSPSSISEFAARAFICERLQREMELILWNLSSINVGSSDGIFYGFRTDETLYVRTESVTIPVYGEEGEKYFSSISSEEKESIISSFNKTVLELWERTKKVSVEEYVSVRLYGIRLAAQSGGVFGIKEPIEIMALGKFTDVANNSLKMWWATFGASWEGRVSKYAEAMFDFQMAQFYRKEVPKRLHSPDIERVLRKNAVRPKLDMKAFMNDLPQELGRSFDTVISGSMKSKPNKAPEPTPGAVTPRATEGASK